MLSDLILSDDLLIRLLQAKFKQDRKLDARQDAGLEVEYLRIDLLTLVLDAMGLPPEVDHDDNRNRDWIWALYLDTVTTGSCEEIQHFFAAVRNGLQERRSAENGS